MALLCYLALMQMNKDIVERSKSRVKLPNVKLCKLDNREVADIFFLRRIRRKVIVFGGGRCGYSRQRPIRAALPRVGIV